MLNLPVSDIMCDHPIKVQPDVSIRNVAHLLLRYRINGILVVSPDDPNLVLGVFTTRDLMRLMGEAMESRAQKMQALNTIAERKLADFLLQGEEVPSLRPDDSAAKAIALMHKKDALTIPVFEGKKLVGVIGRHDLFNIAFA